MHVSVLFSQHSACFHKRCLLTLKPRIYVCMTNSVHIMWYIPFRFHVHQVQTTDQSTLGRVLTNKLRNYRYSPCAWAWQSSDNKRVCCLLELLLLHGRENPKHSMGGNNLIGSGVASLAGILIGSARSAAAHVWTSLRMLYISEWNRYVFSLAWCLTNRICSDWVCGAHSLWICLSLLFYVSGNAENDYHALSVQQHGGGGGAIVSQLTSATFQRSVFLSYLRNSWVDGTLP